jgi:hypothetical protein
MRCKQRLGEGGNTLGYAKGWDPPSPSLLRDRLYGTYRTDGTCRDSLIGPMCPISPIRSRSAELAGPLTISGRSASNFYKNNRFMTGNLMKIG